MSTIATAKTLRKSLRFCIGPHSHLLTHSGAISCASLSSSDATQRLPRKRNVATNNAHASTLGIAANRHSVMPERIATLVPRSNAAISFAFAARAVSHRPHRLPPSHGVVITWNAVLESGRSQSSVAPRSAPTFRALGNGLVGS